MNNMSISFAPRIEAEILASSRHEVMIDVDCDGNPIPSFLWIDYTPTEELWRPDELKIKVWIKNHYNSIPANSKPFEMRCVYTVREVDPYDGMSAILDWCADTTYTVAVVVVRDRFNPSRILVTKADCISRKNGEWHYEENSGYDQWEAQQFAGLEDSIDRREAELVKEQLTSEYYQDPTLQGFQVFFGCHARNHEIASENGWWPCNEDCRQCPWSNLLN